MSRVTSKGQITLPKRLREALGIKPGDDVEFEKRSGEFVLTKKVKHSPFEVYRGFLKELKGSKVDEILEKLRGS